MSKEQSVSAEAKKDSMVHGKPINAKDALLIKELISCCQDILRPVWKAPYLARWVQGMLRPCIWEFNVMGEMI